MTEESRPDPRSSFGGDPLRREGHTRPHVDRADGAHQIAAGHVQSETGHPDDETGHRLPKASAPIDVTPLRDRFSAEGGS
jgi:hypothetical protein